MHKNYNNYDNLSKIILHVEQNITDYKMLQPNDSVLIGVSGGPDSVALCNILHSLALKYSLRLGIAHLNHSIRQQNSDQDAEFVALLAKKFDLPYFVAKEDVRKYQLENRLSLEEAARFVRYTFLYKVAEKNRFNKIALGHNYDDNAEIVLMYLLRGSGPRGAAGIPPVRDSEKKYGQIIRPLMRTKKDEIINFLETKGIKYRIDESNKDIRFIRNKIRRNLIPILKASYNPKVIETLNRLSIIMRSEEEWIENIINPIYERSVSDRQDDQIVLSVSKLNEVHLAAQRRVIRKAIAKLKGNLRRITFFHIDSIISHLQEENQYRSFDYPDDIRVIINNERLVFSKNNRVRRDIRKKPGKPQRLSFEYKILKSGKFLQDSETIFIKEIGKKLEFSKINLGKWPDFNANKQNVAYIDMESLDFPLVIRNFRPGDRFTPLGMTGTQKLKKYFINNKVHQTERARCPVLLSKGKIVWVVGHRIDDSVKVTHSTRNMLNIKFLLT